MSTDISTNQNILRGPSLIATMSVLIMAAVLLTLWAIPDPEQAWRSAVRLTARTSAILFLMAFGAAAAATLWPGNFPRWMRANRRYIGLSFAASHTIHAYTFLSLAGLSEALSHQVLPSGKIIAPIIAYIFILALAITSSDRVQAAMGMRWWQRLHFVGTHFLWLSFLLGFLKHTSEHPEDWLGVCIVIAVMVMRIAASRHRRNAA